MTARTRAIWRVLEGMNLSKAMPFAAVTFTLAGMASMGLPGFSGFVAELQVLIGAWQAFPTLAVVAGFGILVGVAYTMRVVQQAFFGEHEAGAVSAVPNGHGHIEPGADLDSRADRRGALDRAARC